MVQLVAAKTAENDEHSPYHHCSNTGLDDDVEIIPIPQQIRPILAKYRLQVLFWGVRNMKKVQFSTVDSPRVELEWSGYFVKSSTIENAERCPNFPEPVTYIDLVSVYTLQFLRC